MTAVLTEQQTVARFREARYIAATGPRGAASFVWGDFVTEPGTTVHGAPGRWAPLPEGRAGLQVEARAEEGIRIGGRLVDGTAVLHAHPADGPAVARFPGGAEGVLFSYDRSQFALQVWNPEVATLRGFAGIAAYDVDLSWVVEAVLTPVEDGRTVAIPHHRDPRPILVPVIADVAFERDGVVHHLAATQGPDADELSVHFTDVTSGGESSGTGRTVRIPAGAATAVIDFNLAGLLPCSFSPAWNCPLPPAENRLPIPVRAGERQVVDAQGNSIG